MTIHDALTARARELGHSPAVVFRHADTGERTELSWATLHNWASKGANLLLDHCDAGLGAQVRLDMPAHWMAPVLSLAAWATGAAVAVEGECDVHVVHEADEPEGGDLLVGIGMGGRPMGPVPGDALTVVDVLAQPDDFVDDPGDEGAWAVGGRTQATLLSEAIGGGGRVLHAADRVDEALLFLVARTLPAGTGLVIARGYDDVGLKKVATEEKVA